MEATMVNPRTLQAAIGAVLLSATFSLVFLVRPAQAQSGHLMATIPFRFHVGDAQLPAGQYKIEKLQSGIVKLSSGDAHAVAAFHTMETRNVTREPRSGELVFNKYGQDHFLTELWWASQDSGRKTLPSKAERELAKAQNRVRIAATER
jgi:hypothetical protein